MAIAMNLIGISKNGKTVLDRHYSHLAIPKQVCAYVVHNSHVNDTGKTVLTVKIPGFEIEINLVEVDESDKIVYKQRVGRYGETPFVAGKPATVTDTVTVVIARVTDGCYICKTAYPGEVSPKEPHDPSLTEEEKAECFQFWKTHAIRLESLLP